MNQKVEKDKYYEKLEFINILKWRLHLLKQNRQTTKYASYYQFSIASLETKILRAKKEIGFVD